MACGGKSTKSIMASYTDPTLPSERPVSMHHVQWARLRNKYFIRTPVNSYENTRPCSTFSGSYLLHSEENMRRYDTCLLTKVAPLSLPLSTCQRSEPFILRIVRQQS